MENDYYRFPNPAAYAAVDKLARGSKKPRREALRWLEYQDAYTLHKPVRKRFPRRFYNVRNFDDVWEIDLADLRALKTYNDNYSYLLVIIDALSKYLWIEPIRDKSGNSVAEAFERVLQRSGNRVPVMVQSDAGKEFLAKKLQTVLKKNGIDYKPARSPDVKAALAERVIRTIKERLWRYFTHKNSRRYIDVLQNVVEAYNNSTHSATKMAPSDVTLENAAMVRKNLMQRYAHAKIRSPKYSVGSLVRITSARNVFAKGYEGGWTLELFKVDRVSRTRQPVVYYLKDLSGEEIEGFFYEEELSRVRKNLEGESFEVESILKVSGRGSSKKYFVKWKGYPDKFNQWIKASELKDIR